MTPEELEHRIRLLLEADLNLDGGEMMMPLKPHEIDELRRDIGYLVNEAVREATR